MSDVRCGEWVFVRPDERTAPPRVRGLSGTVTRIRDGRATVAFHHDGAEFSLEIDLRLLSPDRRRRNRPPARWSHEIAQTG